MVTISEICNQFHNNLTFKESNDWSEYPELDYYLNEEVSDVVFVFDVHRVPALKNVLTIKSRVFEDLFKESDQSVKKWTLEDTDCEAFEEMIKWLYTERLD